MTDTTPKPEYKPCENCGKAIRPGHNRTRKYCNQACKQEAWRKRNQKAGVTPS